ncbi:HIRAN domain-containing protein [uncultured Chryseobacterium sp.]|uniref:HIRAN domain-containing protein n=1 Tax=uncultured Chryseobacterium sp. TaxID=259322 RepID=UPI0026264FFF|nr:HIRAN domain-containing protein [uncultured Chryseobacterium sp.]
METENNFGISKSDPNLLKALHQGTISFKAFEEDILALESIIAGTSYLNLKEIEKEIIIKESELSLKREPDNEFDKYAVLVFFKEQKIGYLPKSKNQTIARLMDAGKQFYAKAHNKEWEGNWLRIDLEVYLKD